MWYREGKGSTKGIANQQRNVGGRSRDASSEGRTTIRFYGSRKLRLSEEFTALETHRTGCAFPSFRAKGSAIWRCMSWRGSVAERVSDTCAWISSLNEEHTEGREGVQKACCLCSATLAARFYPYSSVSADSECPASYNRSGKFAIPA